MKKRSIFLILVLLLAMIPQVFLGNMAAPREPDMGTAITFQKNDAIAVVSEVLDIRVKGVRAEIVATYHMKNTTAEAVTTPSMFISPNIAECSTKVLVNGKEVTYTNKTYAVSRYSEEGIQAEDWQYVILQEEAGEPINPETYDGWEPLVDTISFDMSFEPNEEFDVVVSYTYRLGGYPSYDFDAKDGEIYYYLRPAAMWKGFEKLTINLYLDEDMPIIKYSSLEFKKVGSLHYQYVSDTLPEKDLSVTIDEDAVQTFFSTLRSPYLFMWLVMVAPLFLPVIILIGVVVFIAVRKRKKKKH